MSTATVTGAKNHLFDRVRLNTIKFNMKEIDKNMENDIINAEVTFGKYTKKIAVSKDMYETDFSVTLEAALRMLGNSIIAARAEEDSIFCTGGSDTVKFRGTVTEVTGWNLTTEDE